MPARPYCFIFELGCTFQRILYLQPGPDAQIEGFTGRMQVRPTIDSNDVIIELTTANGRMSVINGAIVLDVAPDVEIDTSVCTKSGTKTEPDPLGGLPYQATGKLAVFDVEVVSPDGVTTRVFAGEVVFSPEVTRG